MSGSPASTAPMFVDSEYNPFAGWFWMVVWQLNDYALEELPLIWFEIDGVMTGKTTEGNFYVQYYNTQTEIMRFATCELAS